MNTKRLIVLGAVLVVAIAAIIIGNMVSNQKPSEESLQFFPGVSGKTVGAVILKDATDMVKLQRKGDVWVMVPKAVIESAEKQPAATGVGKAMETAPAATAAAKPAGLAATEFPADSSMTAQLLDNIVKVKKNTLVSNRQSKQAAFEVDSAHGVRIEVFDIAGKSLGAVYLGKNGPDYNSCYCRAEWSRDVYMTLGTSRGAFSADHKRWTDKSIMKLDRSKVKKLTIARKGSPAIEIVKGDTATRGWQLVAPIKKNTDSNKVTEILGDLASLSATEFEDSAYSDQTAGLVQPSIFVTVEFMSGTVRTLAIGDKKPGQSNFWCRVPEKPYLFLLGDYIQKKFDKKPEDFLPGAKPAEAVAAPIPAKYRKGAPSAGAPLKKKK